MSCKFPDAEPEVFLLRDNGDPKMYRGGHAGLSVGCGVHGPRGGCGRRTRTRWDVFLCVGQGCVGCVHRRGECLA
jgi:hypothetical protein